MSNNFWPLFGEQYHKRCCLHLTEETWTSRASLLSRCGSWRTSLVGFRGRVGGGCRRAGLLRCWTGRSGHRTSATSSTSSRLTCHFDLFRWFKSDNWVEQLFALEISMDLRKGRELEASSAVSCFYLACQLVMRDWMRGEEGQG